MNLNLIWKIKVDLIYIHTLLFNSLGYKALSHDPFERNEQTTLIQSDSKYIHNVTKELNAVLLNFFKS